MHKKAKHIRYICPEKCNQRLMNLISHLILATSKYKLLLYPPWQWSRYDLKLISRSVVQIYIDNNKLMIYTSTHFWLYLPLTLFIASLINKRPHEFEVLKVHLWPCRKVAWFKVLTAPDHDPFQQFNNRCPKHKFLNMSKRKTVIVDGMSSFSVYHPALVLWLYSV